MKITTIHSPWMNLLMLYTNLMIQLLARMMSSTKCLNTSLMMLCSLYSTFLITSGLREKFPTSWCTSTVIPVPKPGKDTSDPSNYRPIALTSCICKVMERMINSRLVWYLERNKLISPMQCGFRKQRSTTDHLVRLESFFREVFAQSTCCRGLF